MISYSQRDPRWSDEKLGSSPLTIGRFGCTMTCIADLSTYFIEDPRAYYNPHDLNKIIKFTPEGLIVWQSCNFREFVFDSRVYGRNDEQIKAALKDPNRAVILQVANASHWVVALSWNLLGLRIADPWLGDKTSISRYKNDITGAAYFRRR